MISVKIADRQDVVNRVIGVVQEDTRMKFKFHDDGLDPDRKAGDGVWSIRVDVPFMAPPGKFTFAITAYDAQGEAILAKAKGGGTTTLSAACELTIAHPETQ